MLCMLSSDALAAPWKFQTVEGDGGVPLNVATAGDPLAPAILFVHGLAQSHYSFVRQLDSGLADRFFLVAFDLRGHGGSGKPWQAAAYRSPEVWARDVAAVMQATGLRKPVMVAWSYGTMVAMDYVRVFGTASLAGIVLTGGLGGLPPPVMPAPGAAPPDPAMLEAFQRNRSQQLSPNLVDNIEVIARTAGLLTAAPVVEPQRRYFESISLMFPAYARREIQARSMDNRDLVEKLRLPVLLSLGERDFNPGQVDAARALAKEHANIAVSVYEGTGHSVFLEQPARFNEELESFARRVQAVAER